MTPTTQTDRIENEVLIRAAPDRVWRALTDHKEFGTWFRAELSEPFAAGKTVNVRITHPGYEHVRFDMFVERIEPQSYFAYRWHPYAIDPKIDYSKEPTTLVEFRLETVPEGTRLTVVESGFDRLPAGRRDEAFRMNSRGWEGQIQNVKQHVGG